MPAGPVSVPLQLTPRPCPQVQRFLEMSGQAPDVVERYCALYWRLRGATEELFGQRAAFVAALGQGFARALQQLSFLTALHVSPGPSMALAGACVQLWACSLVCSLPGPGHRVPFRVPRGSLWSLGPRCSCPVPTCPFLFLHR